jgi:(p)ppGpp synthase/HD superfamily hydrolase
MYQATIERALRVAYQAHAPQTRKGSDVPYVLHPIHAALILSGCNASEDVIVATLLHDVVEDCEGWDLDRMETEFGPRVRSIIAEVTEDKDLSWEDRKQAAIDHVPHLSPEALLVKGADKLHNLSSLLADLQAADNPEEVWRPFTRGAEQTLQMSRLLVEALVPRLEASFGQALLETLEALEAQAS